MRFGVLLPHFGAAATGDHVIKFAEDAEARGLDSVWVRDNFNYRPHEFEPPGNRFIDPFTVLAAVAARTTKVRIGTAVLTPFRPALVTAQQVGGLCLMSNDRFELGVGPGTPRRPWEAFGLDYGERVARCSEMVEVVRLLSAEGPKSYAGRFASFENVQLDPGPSRNLTVWYGGASRFALEALATYADGLMPGRCPLDVLQGWVGRYLDQFPDAARPRLALQTLVAPAKSQAQAMDRLRAAGVLEAISRRWKREAGTIVDLVGAVVAGTPDDCIDQLHELAHAGIELLILDFRLADAGAHRQFLGFVDEVLSQFHSEASDQSVPA